MSDVDIGHNSEAANQIKSIIERAERLEEDKKAVMEDLKELFKEAAGNGLDVKIIKQVLKIRRADPNERSEQEVLLDRYLKAVGMQSSFSFGP